MALRLAVFFVCVFAAVSLSYTTAKSFRRSRRTLQDLVAVKIKENDERGGNVYDRILAVNDAHREAAKRNDNSVAGQILDINDAKHLDYLEGDIRIDPIQTKRNVIKNAAKKWPNKIVYYAFASNTNSIRPVVEQAIAKFEEKSCLTFREVDRTFAGDFIKFTATGGCSSAVGRQGGMQLITVGSGCETLGMVMHLINHAIGIFHEHSRPDRDDYVTIVWDNILTGKAKYFQKIASDKINTLGLPYDFDSIMQFGRYMFSKDSGRLKTIIKKNEPWASLGGQYFSTNDVREINTLYGC